MDSAILKIIEDAEQEAENIVANARTRAGETVAKAQTEARELTGKGQEESQRHKKKKLSEAILIAEHGEAIKKREIDDEVAALKAITANRIDSAVDCILEKVEEL